MPNAPRPALAVPDIPLPEIRLPPDLWSAISICLLDKTLFRDEATAHHRFRLIDPENGMEIPDSIEVHTLELTKYNFQEATISVASAIEQWAFFFLFANRYEPERFRELLPGVEFQQAISLLLMSKIVHLFTK